MRNLLSHPLGYEHESAYGAHGRLGRAHEMVVTILKSTVFDWPREAVVLPPPPNFVVLSSDGIQAFRAYDELRHFTPRD